MDDATRKVWLADGTRVDADLLLVGGKQIAHAWGISLQRFKQLCAMWHAKPSAAFLADPTIPDYIKQGALRRRPLVPKNAQGQYELTAREAMWIYSSQYAMVRDSRPDSSHDPVTGKIVGKTFRTTRRELMGLPPLKPVRKARPSQKRKPREPAREQARLRH